MHIAVHALVALSLYGAAASPALAQGADPPAQAPPRPDSAAAQVRPDSAPPPPAKRPDRWKFAAEMSFTDHSGNKSLRVLTGGLKFSHREKRAFELDGNLQSRYGRSGDEVVARNYFAALNYSPHASALSPTFTLSAERDPFKRLDLRFSSGGGVKFTPYQSEEGIGEAAVSLSLSYEFTNLQVTETDTEDEFRHRPRWSMELDGSQRLTTGITAQHQSSFAPSWRSLADYLLRSQTGLKVVLTRRLALSVQYQLTRTSLPPEGVEPDDRLFKTGLIIDF